MDDMADFITISVSEDVRGDPQVQQVEVEKGMDAVKVYTVEGKECVLLETRDLLETKDPLEPTEEDEPYFLPVEVDADADPVISLELYHDFYGRVSIVEMRR